MSTEQGGDAAAGDVSQPPAGGAAGDQRTVGDILEEKSTKQYVKYNAGVFAAIGVGFALALVLTDALVSSGSALGGGAGSTSFAVAGLSIAFFLSPLIAGITGTVTSLRLEDTEKAVATAAGAGAFAGYVALLLLVVVTAGIVGDGGSSGFTDELLALLGFGVGVAAAGGLTAVVTERFA